MDLTMYPVIPEYHPDEFEDEEKWVWESFMLGLRLRIKMIRVSFHYLIVELRESGGFVLLEEGTGPWHELRGFLSKDWSANSGEIAEEGDGASSFHPSVGSESIDSLRLGSTDRLTSYSSYFEELSTESESGGVFELESISSEDDCVFVS